MYDGKWILKVRQYVDYNRDSVWNIYAVCSECGRGWHGEEVIGRQRYFIKDMKYFWDNRKLSVDEYNMQRKRCFDGIKGMRFYADRLCAPYCEHCGLKMDNEFMINERMCMAE